MSKPLDKADFSPELINEMNTALESGKEIVIKKEKENVVILKQSRKIVVKKPV